MTRAIVLILAVLASACGTAPKCACGASIGTGGCRSVSRVHDDAARGGGSAATTPNGPVATSPARAVAVPDIGNALLTRPRVVRVLVLPWEDDGGDLNAGGYIYLRLDRGAWTLTN